MGTMTISLSGSASDWIESQVEAGAYASPDAYVRELIERDRAQQGRDINLDDVRRLVVDARASGPSQRTVEELFEQARETARTRGTLRA